ncbi:S-locus glycoprotein [Corchorus capsularis]|uniref:non-specific serine/threonine protein kinase n=1 Tax=Corchorus capsularis TaxID=210143 RepID=A0A1R3IQE6_COCAP|nr:S-locus glycoprotein [Corchorus capsularis]
MGTTSRWSVHMLSTLLIYYTVLILSCPQYCCSASARDNITISTNLVDGETLVSAGNRFELGFFGPPRSSIVKRYLGIWYKSNPQVVVWVANRRRPVSDISGVLSISGGNLRLNDARDEVYWSTQLELKRSNPQNLVARLNDNGNFILLDYRSGDALWQSFDQEVQDQPIDTFLSGMKINERFALTSWTTEEDPDPGSFIFKQEDPERSNQFVIMEKSLIHWRSSRPESGNIFESNDMPDTIFNLLNFSGNSTEVFTDKRLVMNYTGELQYWQLNTTTKHWSLIWKEPKDNCSVFNFCGNFGTCNANNKLPCQCLPGFNPKFPEKWNASDFLDGCSRTSVTSCGNDFLSLKKMKVAYPGSPYEANDETDCRGECLKNCQCQAYSYLVQNGSNSCFTWTEELKNLQDNQDGGYDLYVRVALSDIESTVRNCETCGINLVPYPLSTGPDCGDPMYSNFYCNNKTDHLSFMTSSGNYNVIRVNPEVRAFVIQMPSKEVGNCNASQSSASRILQLNQSLPFNVTNWCSGDSPVNGTLEVEISWKPPLEPTCVSSTDCKDWPNSSCNNTGNGQKRCLCTRNFHWDGIALNCTQELISKGGPSDENKPVILGVSLAIGTAFLCVVVSIYMWRRKAVKKLAKQRKAVLHRYDTERGVKELMDLSHFEEKDGTGIDVPFFDFESILAATDNFSDENKLGKGGFGPVYKGKFPGGQEMAVKRLSSVSGQGLEEFKNEVVLIAKLQHRNLVRLLGYCIRGEEKILLYEYMPNKSLDSWIFDETFRQQLDWETRFNIILGIARGLLYLHQDSRLRIIHRDLKTSNILLDAEMNPKISDFGLARMMQGKETEANTLKVIGTYGYMAPEYALDGLFSVKSDVFSFGVLMLEIVSGKKNMRFYQVEDAPSLIGYAWRVWQEGKALDLMEETVRSSCNASEFLRCVHVGLLCVQEDPSERPSMSNVVVSLGSETSSLPIPKQPAFLTRRTVSTSVSTSSKAEAISEITSALQEGR